MCSDLPAVCYFFLCLLGIKSFPILLQNFLKDRAHGCLPNFEGIEFDGLLATSSHWEELFLLVHCLLTGPHTRPLNP